VGRHVTPLGHIILIPNQSFIALSISWCVLRREATNSNYIGCGLTRSHYTTDAVKKWKNYESLVMLWKMSRYVGPAKRTLNHQLVIAHRMDKYSGAPELSTVSSGVRVTWSLDLCVCFIDRSLYFCPVFGHCVVCSSSIYGLWLLLWCTFKLFL
jgi:hypothetical protein